MVLIVTTPDLLGSCTLVARKIVALELARLGAVNVILEPVDAEIVPAPLTTFQSTPVPKPFVPVTTAFTVVVVAASSVVASALTATPVMLEPAGSAFTFKPIVFDLLGSCTLVARTIVTLEFAKLGAVKVMLAPEGAEIVPVPLMMLQLTSGANPFVPLTLALKTAGLAAFKLLTSAVSATAVMLEVTGTGLTFTTTVSFLLESALLVAVTLTSVLLVTLGALNVTTLPVFFESSPAVVLQVTFLLNSPLPLTSANNT